MISICSQIKDRNSFLDQTLPTWLETSCDEVVIFDWPYKERAWDVVKKYDDPRIKLYEKEDRGLEYNKSSAKNTCVRMSGNNLVLFVDSDIKLKVDFLEEIQDINHNEFMQGFDFFIKSLTGLVVFNKKQFDKVNGFNEKLVGWGEEDTDFYNRLINEGYKRIRLPAMSFFEHIDHNDFLRTEFYSEKDTKKSLKINENIARKSPWTKKNIQMNHSVITYPLKNTRVI